MAANDAAAADKVTFKVSSAAAPYLGADKPREDRLKAAAGLVTLPPTDFVLLLYYLCHDQDPEVKRTAMASLRGLDQDFLSQLLADPELHPRILDALVQLHFNKSELVPLFASHPMLSDKAATFLIRQGAFLDPTADPGGQGSDLEGETPGAEAGETPAEPGCQLPGRGRPDDACQGVDDYAAADAAADPDEPVVERSEEFQSKFQMAQSMGVGEKIKAALTGDKEWRSILIKDSNKLVSVSVIRNPRISDGEVLTIAKSAVQNEEIMRVICTNKEWIKNPLIRKALAENNKTPIPAALRFVATLSEKELAMLGRNKNVASVISSQARRILMTKRDGR